MKKKDLVIWGVIIALMAGLLGFLLTSLASSSPEPTTIIQPAPTQTPAQTPAQTTSPTPTTQTKTILDVIVGASGERIKSGETIYVEGIFTGKITGNDNSYVRYFLLGQPDINWFVAAGVETKSPEYAGFRALKEGDRVVIKGNYDYYDVNLEAAVLNNCSLVR